MISHPFLAEQRWIVDTVEQLLPVVAALETSSPPLWLN